MYSILLYPEGCNADVIEPADRICATCPPGTKKDGYNFNNFCKPCDEFDDVYDYNFGGIGGECFSPVVTGFWQYIGHNSKEINKYCILLILTSLYSTLLL